MQNKNISLKKIFLFAGFIFQLNAIIAGNVFSKDLSKEQPSVFFSGTIEDSSGSIQFIKEIDKDINPRYIESKNSYVLSSDSSLKMTKVKKPTKLSFKLSPDLSNDLKKNLSHSNIGENLITREIKLNYFPELINSNSQDFNVIGNFEELWIDYDDSNFNQALINLSLNLSSSQDNSNYQIISKTFYPEGLNVGSQIFDNNYKQKDFSYLFGRTLRLNGTNQWNYSEDDKFVVLQKRFNKDLSNVDLIDLSLSQEVHVEAINLRIKTEYGTKIVEWDSLNALNQKYKDRDKIAKISMFTSSLKEQYKEIFLEEVIVFFSDTLGEILIKKPLKSIDWIDLEDKSIDWIDLKDTKIIKVNSQIEEISDSKKRLKINLIDLRNKVDSNSQIISLNLEIKPRDNHKKNNLKLLDINLIHHKDVEIPVIVSKTLDSLKKWGINIDDYAVYDNKFLWPHFYKNLNTIPAPINQDPQGRWIDFDLKVGEVISRESFLYLGGKKTLNEPLFVRVTPYSLSGAKLGNWFSQLNSLVQFSEFKDENQEIDHILIRVYLNDNVENNEEVTANKSPLSELVLFSLNTISIDEILDAQFPFSQNLKLEIESEPSNIFTIETQDGGLRFSIDDFSKFQEEELSFNTIINNNSSNVKSLEINYLSTFFDSIFHECWLEMTALGGGKQIQYKICLNGNLNKKMLTLPEWVNNINWRIIPPDEKYYVKSMKELIVSMKIHYSSSVMSEIMSHPFLALNYNELLPVRFNSSSFRDLHFDFGNFESFDNIQYFEHPWLNVDRVFFEKEDPYTLKQWKSISSKRLTAGSVNKLPLKLLFFLVAVLAASFIFYFGWYKKLIQLFKNSVVSIPNLKVSWIFSFYLWTILAFCLMFASNLFGFQKINIYSIFGSITGVLAWRALLVHFKSKIKLISPLLTNSIYSDASSKYFLGVVTIVFLIAIISTLGFEKISEQLILLGYFMLSLALVLELTLILKVNDNIIKKV